MQKDSIVLIVCLISLTILGIIIAVFDISPDRLAILRAIIDILAVVLGASGYARVMRLLKK